MVQGAPVWTQQRYLKPPFPEAGDKFGSALAIAGETIIVGAPFEDSNGSSPVNNSVLDSGAAYVFVRANGLWSQQRYLKPAIGDVNDLFGWSVAIAGDTIVVGAIGESSNGTGPSDNSASLAGAAYVFGRANGLWSQHGYLKAANANADDWFGSAVATTGTTVVVGAWHEASTGGSPADNSALNAGAAYVFGHSSPQGAFAWTQTRYLKASNAQAHDYFGAALAIDGTTVVAGAWGEDGNGSSPTDNTAPGAGAVYMIQIGTPTYVPLIVRP
jgi:hypothetical protein